MVPLQLANPVSRGLYSDGSTCLPWTWLIESELLLFIFAPLFIVVSRSSKFIGYALLFTVIAISIAFSAFFLDFKKVDFQPSLIFNGPREYVYEWQMNPLVRSSNFAIGLLFGIFFVNALEKIEVEDSRSNEYKFGKLIKRSKVMQTAMQLIGVLLMCLAFWLVVPASDEYAKPGFVRFFLAGCPTIFLFGMGIFIMPSILGADGWLTRVLNKLLGSI